MTGLCFVDANVFVYAGDPREPVKQHRATAWLDHLWREQRGRTSSQALSESYVNLKRVFGTRASPEEIWPRVAKYFAWNPLAVDEPLLLRAREIERRYLLSWWDSMIVAAAQLQECRTLLTEDLQDGMTFGTVRVRDPFLHVVEEPLAEYTVAIPARSLHRPRGRPRRAATA